MGTIFDDLNRLEEMKAKLDEKFNKAATYSPHKAAEIAAGYASVTQAIHALRESDTFFSETIRQLNEEGTEEARMEAIHLQRERRNLKPKCDRSDGRRRPPFY